MIQLSDMQEEMARLQHRRELLVYSIDSLAQQIAKVGNIMPNTNGNSIPIRPVDISELFKMEGRVLEFCNGDTPRIDFVDGFGQEETLVGTPANPLLGGGANISR